MNIDKRFMPDKPFWMMSIDELKNYVNKFKQVPKKNKKKFRYKKRFTKKSTKYRGKKIKIKLKKTRKNIIEY